MLLSDTCLPPVFSLVDKFSVSFISTFALFHLFILLTSTEGKKRNKNQRTINNTVMNPQKRIQYTLILLKMMTSMINYIRAAFKILKQIFEGKKIFFLFFEGNENRRETMCDV